MKEWIDARRVEVKAQQEQALAVANQAAGALKMLDALEAELNKPQAVETPAPASDEAAK